MRTWVALFRGINVGGNNILPMKDLVAALEDAGARDVETYVQSGNAVFRSEETNASSLSDRIRAAIKQGHGFEPRVLLLGSEEVEGAVRSNPFPEAESEPKTLHVYFLALSPERPDLDALEGPLLALLARGARWPLCRPVELGLGVWASVANAMQNAGGFTAI